MTRFVGKVQSWKPGEVAAKLSNSKNKFGGRTLVTESLFVMNKSGGRRKCSRIFFYLFFYICLSFLIWGTYSIDFGRNWEVSFHILDQQFSFLVFALE